jgi:hypothetical protein
MSIHSKAKRDARKKREKRAVAQRPAGGFVAHAQLLDADGVLVAAGGRYQGHWAAVVAGKAVPGVESAALLLAMLRHIAARCDAEGRTTTLTVSPVLEKAAAMEAEAGGHTLEDYLALLEAERVENAEKRRAAAH